MMKKLAILSAIAVSGLFYIKTANAQISIHVGLNIPVRHVYVPAPQPVVVQETPVYDDDNVPASYDDDYYYLPEVEAYYCVPRHCYYYNDGSSWVSAAYLPGAYRNYNWRTAVRYEVRASRPYMRHDFYRSRWGGYAGGRANWGRRFDNRGGYAYSSRDNRGWGRGDYGRGNWGGRSYQNDNRGWNRDNHDRGNWSNSGNDNRNRGNWGGQRSDNRDNGNRGGQRFADNRSGYGTRQ